MIQKSKLLKEMNTNLREAITVILIYLTGIILLYTFLKNESSRFGYIVFLALSLVYLAIMVVFSGILTFFKKLREKIGIILGLIISCIIELMLFIILAD